LVAVLGLIATLIGIPLGVEAGRGFAAIVGQMLNFTIYSEDIPAWVFLVEILAGTLIPLLVALIPVLGALTLLVFYLLDGTPGPNRFGPDPKERGVDDPAVFS
jgi:putative ABC transport system permease protein